jgi:lipoprotein-anchoring transpeptidase ErfK/SrfK
MRRALLAVLAAGLLFVGACSSDTDQTSSAPPQQEQRPAPPDYKRLVATAKGPSVPAYRSPGDSGPFQQFSNPREDGVPRVFLVEERPGDGWLNVLLPVRPNGSTGWVKESDVTLTETDYRMKVEIAAHKITVWKGLEVFLEEPIGVGKGNTPTPSGKYFVTELIQPPNPNGPYGVYAYGLSGFSDVFKQFSGGNGQVGIHGTNDPAGIGKDVSAGCIRLRNEAITKLANALPLGTPVEIAA